MEPEEIKQSFDEWCILELFGHIRLAGHVTEATIGGCSFLRVDVPDRDGEGIKFTRYYGNGAIYSMTPVTEEVARRVGDGNSQPPVKPWEMSVPQLAAASDDDFERQASCDSDDYD